MFWRILTPTIRLKGKLCNSVDLVFQVLFAQIFGITLTFTLSSQLQSGFEYIKIYEGGSEYANLVENITGSHTQTNISISGNQMFVKFKSTSTVTSKGFKAFIHKIGKLI